MRTARVQRVLTLFITIIVQREPRCLSGIFHHLHVGEFLRRFSCRSLPADSATKKRATPTRNGPRQNPPMGDHRRGVTGAFQITNQLDGCWLIPSVSPWLVESLYLFFTSPSPFISLHILIVVWMLIKDLRCNAYLVGGFNPPL